jgi:regulator of RNase E activity RraA
MKDIPMLYRGAHASAMAVQMGVQWNGPVRLGGIMLPSGDIVVDDAEGVQVIPPQPVAGIISAAEETVHGREHQARDDAVEEVPRSRHLSQPKVRAT